MIPGECTVAQIFISHSKRDEEIKNLFFRGFTGTNVSHVLKEYEDVSPPGTLPDQLSRNMAQVIENDILGSSAVFVILSKTVQALPNTTHWIVWETAQAKALKKSIWVFEPYNDFRAVTITIPHFDHYVRFRMDDEWRRFIHKAAASYNDTPVFVTAGGAGLGALLVGGLPAVIIGGLLGYLSSTRIECPKGFKMTCDQCFLSYEVHLPTGKGEFRCANCNKPWSIT